MTQENWEEWPARLANRVAQEVRRHRMRRGMSAQQLADVCAQLGLPLSRSALANLESGRRPTVSLAEVLVLGKALGVPPIELVFPVGREEQLVEVLPGKKMGAWEAVKWFSGEGPFLQRAEDGAWYATPGDHDEWQESAITDYRWHDTYVRQCLDALSAAKGARKAAALAETEAEQEAHLRHAKSEEAQYRLSRKLLHDHRVAMRRRDVIPPDLWGEAFEGIDEQAGKGL